MQLDAKHSTNRRYSAVGLESLLISPSHVPLREANFHPASFVADAEDSMDVVGESRDVKIFSPIFFGDIEALFRVPRHPTDARPASPRSVGGKDGGSFLELSADPGRYVGPSAKLQAQQRGVITKVYKSL